MVIIKYDILCVSKSVAWYQKYAHITACLVTGYIPRPGSRTRFRLYLHLARSTQMTTNIKEEILRYASISITTYIQPEKSTETTMHHVITHIQGAVENRKLHLSFLRY